MSSKITAALVGLMVFAIGGGLACAGVFVRDTFTSADGTVGSALDGRTPADVNVPADVWHLVGTQPDGIISTDGARNVAQSNADDGYRTQISGSVPANLLVSTTMKYTTPSPTTTDGLRGVSVGFWTNNTAANGFTHFTGLQLGSKASSDPTLTLKLWVDGSVVDSTAYTGTRTDPADYHDLSYGVHTVSGAVSDIVLDGDSYSFSTSGFSTTNTYYFGYLTTGYFGPERGRFDFVQLETLPEPTSLAMVSAGLAGLALRRRRIR